MCKIEKITRRSRTPQVFDVIDLFDAIGRKEQFVLGNKKDQKKFVEIVGNSLTSNLTATMIYGKRVESMFSYVAASLGKCSLIKKEDCGDLFTSEKQLEIPDYRLILNDQRQLFVEVKSYFQKDPFSEYTMNLNYLNALVNYSKLLNTPLYIAIYWSRWNIWTLILPEDLRYISQKAKISFSEAIKRNRMSEIGDVVIGTTPPLTIRIVPDKTKPHSINEYDVAEFVIEKIELYCNGVQITDENEKHIAVSLMQYGDWVEDSRATLSDKSNNTIECIEFSYSPIQYNAQQNFQIINAVSTIISRQYSQLTVSNGQVKRLTPNIEPDILGFIIPKDYHSKALPLWRLHITPHIPKNDISE